MGLSGDPQPDGDRFKFVNDLLGQDAGDALQKVTAAHLSALLRGADRLARLGGDAFVVSLDEVTDPAALPKVAGRLLTELTEPLQLGARILQPSGNVGTSLSPAGGQDPAAQLSVARGLPHNADATAIVQALVTLAHDLRMAVVAEGVETPDQRPAARPLGCDRVQGDLLGRPLPAGHMAGHLPRWRAAAGFSRAPAAAEGLAPGCRHPARSGWRAGPPRPAPGSACPPGRGCPVPAGRARSPGRRRRR